MLVLSQEGLAPRSLRWHQSRIAKYEKACSDAGITAWPASLESVHPFLTDVAGWGNWATIRAYAASIRRVHLDREWEDPFESQRAKATLQVLRRQCLRRRRPDLFHTQDLAAILDRIPATDKGDRDRAMLHLVHAIRLSCESLTELDRYHITFCEEGMRVDARYGRHRKNIPISRYSDTRYCPVAAMEQYLRLLKDDDDLPLFRCFSNRSRMKTRRLTRAAADRALAQVFATPGEPKDKRRLRSLHASAVVTALRRGAAEYAVARQMGFRHTASVTSIKERYDTDAVNITRKLGL